MFEPFGVKTKSKTQFGGEILGPDLVIGHQKSEKGDTVVLLYRLYAPSILESLTSILRMTFHVSDVYEQLQPES